MENIKVLKSVSRRGQVFLIVNNYKFNFKRDLVSGEKSWRCRTPKCLATITTVGEEHNIVKCNLDHNHPEMSASIIQKDAISVAAKRKAVEDISSNPNKILRHVLSDNIPSEAIQCSDLTNIKKVMYNARRKLLPQLPKSREEVHAAVRKMCPILTNRKEDYIVHNEENSQIIIFSCKNNLEWLSKCETVYMDGTFDYCPKYFLQLFTVFGHLNGHYVPMVFCLLADKFMETYSRCFKIIKDKCNHIGYNWCPRAFVVDFEKAIQNAILLAWPDAAIIGCRFHISQAWWRKIQQLGLTKDYKEKTEVGKWLGYCFGLLFLGKTSSIFYKKIRN